MVLTVKEDSSVNHYGVYRGIVVSNSDPLLLMRVQVQVAAVLGDDVVWALPCVPVGSSSLPDPGTLVWIMFEGGDAQSPVWMGTATAAL